jgi:hypothetical protein
LPGLKKIQTTPAGFIVIIFLAAFLCSGAAPDRPFKNRKKSGRTEIRYRKTECNRTPMKEYKKLTGYNKTINRPPKTRY